MKRYLINVTAGRSRRHLFWARAVVFFLSSGMALCGCVAVIAGLRVNTTLEEPFRRNINALTATMTELERTVVALRENVLIFDAYLDDQQKSGDDIASEIDGLRKQSGRLTSLMTNDVAKILSNAGVCMEESSKALKQLGNDTAHYPLGPVQNARGPIYEASSVTKEISDSLADVSRKLANIAKESGGNADGILEESADAIRDTGRQLDTLRHGPLREIPGTLDSLSSELRVHLGLVSSSADLVRLVTWPLIAIGFGFLLAGFRGMVGTVFQDGSTYCSRDAANVVI